jgi:predicted lipid-binding transport protein (Tim44 family)
MGTDNIITLFFLIVAALIFLNLRSVLGKRTGNEKPPFDPNSRDQRQMDSQAEPADDGKVITLPRREQSQQAPAETFNRYQVIDDFVPAGTELNDKLRRVYDVDPTFEPRQFVDGAKVAYEMVVTAFAQGDRQTLKNLLSRDVYEGFAGAIDDREKAGQILESRFVGIDKAHVTAADLKGKRASITLRFIAEFISATLDKAGVVIEGDPKQVRQITDVWTFERDTSSRDPNWKLVATDEPG